MEYRPILANNRLSYSFPSMADRKLTFIPIIFIVLRVWSTVRFVMFLLDSPARQNPVLVILHVSYKPRLIRLRYIYLFVQKVSYVHVQKIYYVCFSGVPLLVFVLISGLVKLGGSNLLFKGHVYIQKVQVNNVYVQ